MPQIGKKQFAAALLAGLLLVTAGCAKSGGSNAGNSGGSGDGKLQVEASFYPMYEFTKNVAGDLADVHTLIPATVEPHDWEPTPKDIKSIEDADLLVYNGAGLEGWVDQVISSSDNKKLVAVEASKGIAIKTGYKDEDEDEDEDGGAAGAAAEENPDGGQDPHVWLSPKQAIQEVRNIQAGLSEAAPDHAGEFKANADAYVEKLTQLDKEFAEELSNPKRMDFITQHAAFAYLAQDYGLTQVPIAGLSPDQEPSASQMADIVKFAKAHDTKTIFFETLVSSKVAETVAKEIGAKSAVLNPIEGLTEEDEANHEDYLSIMRQNLQALETALNE